MKKIIASCLALVLLFSAAAFAGNIVHWRGLDRESTLVFSHGAGKTQSPIMSFTSEMAFEPDRPQESSVTLFADLAYVFLSPAAFDDPAVRQALSIGESLGGSRTTGPASAILTSREIRRQADGSFLFDGTLSINSRSQPVQFPFTAAVSRYFDQPKLTLRGAVTFHPQRFADGVKLAAPEGVEEATLTFVLAATPTP